MLGTKIILQFLLDNSINLISFVATIILARAFGPEILGLIGFILAVIGMIAFMGDLGFTQAHIKKVSEGYNLGFANGSFFLIKLILGLIILIFSLSYLLWGKYFGVVGISAENRIIFVILLFGFLFFYFGQAILYTFQARQEVVKYNLALLFGRLTKTIIIILSALLALGILAVASAYFFEGLIVLVIAAFLLRKYSIKLPRIRDLRVYFNYALPLMILVPIAQFSSSIDRLILKNFWGVGEVGFFFAIQSLIALPQSFSTAAMNLFFPQASALLKRGKHIELQKYTDLVVKYLGLITIPLIVLIIMFAKPLVILVLGVAFEKASTVLQVFALATLVLTISRPYSYVLLSSKKHKFFSFINVFALILIIIFDFIFIPRSIFGLQLFGFGATGAALASLLGWGIGLVLFSYVSYRFTKIKFYFSLFKQLVAGGLMFGFLKLMTIWFHLLEPLFIIGVAIFSLVLFMVILYFLREITVGDFHYLRTIIKPKSFFSTVGQEWEEKVV